MNHDIMPMAYNLQAQGPDEYPLGFYVELARQRINPTLTEPDHAKTRTRNRWSVLR